MARKTKASVELRELIAAAHMTQGQAAEALGVTRRAVENWVASDGIPPRMALLAMRWIAQHEPLELAPAVVAS